MSLVRLSDQRSDTLPSDRVGQVMYTPSDDGGSALADALFHEIINEGELIVGKSGRDRCCHTMQYTNCRAARIVNVRKRCPGKCHADRR